MKPLLNNEILRLMEKNKDAKYLISTNKILLLRNLISLGYSYKVTNNQIQVFKAGAPLDKALLQ